MIKPPKFQWHREQGQDMKVKDWIQVINETQVSLDVTILGVPFARASISPSGAAEFPDAFRKSWELFTPYYIDDLYDFSHLQVADIGDVMVHATDVEKSHENIEVAMSEVLKKYANKLHITIGGDHSITAPIVRAIAKQHPSKKIGIVQFDTHLDMRDFTTGRTNGTPIRQLVEEGIVEGKHIYNIGLHGFYNAPSLIEAAKRHHINMIPLKQLRKNGIKETIANVFQQLSDVDIVYVTVDIDVLDVAYAPGVPSATPGGMRSDELFDCLNEVGKHPIFAMDFVCIDPLRDIANQTVKATTYAFLTFMASFGKHQVKKKSNKTLRVCENGHKFYKSSDCPVCPICEQNRQPNDEFLTRIYRPAKRALEANGITTLEKLSEFSEKEILTLHGMGPSSIPILKEALKEKGLSFKEENETF